MYKADHPPFPATHQLDHLWLGVIPQWEADEGKDYMRTSPFSDGLAPHFDPDGISELAKNIYGGEFDDFDDFQSYIADEPDEVRMLFCRYMYSMTFKHLGKAMVKTFWFAPTSPAMLQRNSRPTLKQHMPKSERLLPRI